MSTIIINVTASNARTTDTGASYKGTPGVDVDVRVRLPNGETVPGAVTLLPREDGREGLASWGGPDNWVSGALLVALYAAYPDSNDLTEALNCIEAEASAVVA